MPPSERLSDDPECHQDLLTFTVASYHTSFQVHAASLSRAPVYGQTQRLRLASCTFCLLEAAC